MPDKPLLIFDGNCGFCKIWIKYWYQLTGGRIDYAPSQEVGEQFPQIPHGNFSQSVQLVLPSGEVLRGARAVFQTLTYAPGFGWLLWLYRHLPGFAAVTEASYRVIAAHRSFFYQVTRFTFGLRVSPLCYASVEWLFLRILSAIYFIAFASFGVQITGLIGERGILPLGSYLQAISENFGMQGYWMLPSVFWIAHGDVVLRAVCIAGAAISIVLLFGYFERTSLICLFVLYLSLCSAGQDFMSFQWDMLLLESGFLAIFLGSSKLVVFLFRWLLFRLTFLSGAVKLMSHDPAWSGLTALSFHYWTQPLPTRIAWYMNQLPAALQRLSTATVLVIELAVPFLIFGPRLWRFFGAGAMLLLQVLIFLTGNYTFFNLLTMALCLFLFDDGALAKLRLRLRPVHCRPLFTRGAAVLILFLSTLELLGVFFDWNVMNSVLRETAPFGIVNTYGLFAVMTTTRPEIIVQGSNDGATWLDYEFKYKPGDPRIPPRWVAPHQPRLDWQMWFAALSSFRNAPWFHNFMVRLLQGSPEVLGLLQKDPFHGTPPKHVRALLFSYKFTDFTTRRETGAWWTRSPRGLYFSQMSNEPAPP
ncbi:MAG TPA: lipase maturation factor family protein [Bryobacteraceae bacterium]